MPRIVAGTAKGMTFRVPKSARPTPDMVREAIFSTLEHRGYLDDTMVLDLFAGSGAFGLEAASRGVRSVTSVDSNREAAQVITANAKKAGLDLHVINQKVGTYLGTGVTEFDLIFADPPYGMEDSELGTVLEHVTSRLVDDGLLLVERDKYSGEPPWPDGLVLDEQRTWGDTVIWFALREEYARTLKA